MDRNTLVQMANTKMAKSGKPRRLNKMQKPGHVYKTRPYSNVQACESGQGNKCDKAMTLRALGWVTPKGSWPAQ